MSFPKQNDGDPTPHVTRPPDDQLQDTQVSLPLHHDVQPLDTIQLPALSSGDSSVAVPDLPEEPPDSVLSDTERLGS